MLLRSSLLKSWGSNNLASSHNTLHAGRRPSTGSAQNTPLITITHPPEDDYQDVEAEMVDKCEAEAELAENFPIFRGSIDVIPKSGFTLTVPQKNKRGRVRNHEKVDTVMMRSRYRSQWSGFQERSLFSRLVNHFRPFLTRSAGGGQSRSVSPKLGGSQLDLSIMGEPNDYAVQETSRKSLNGKFSNGTGVASSLDMLAGENIGERYMSTEKEKDGNEVDTSRKHASAVSLENLGEIQMIIDDRLDSIRRIFARSKMDEGLIDQTVDEIASENHGHGAVDDKELVTLMERVNRESKFDTADRNTRMVDVSSIRIVDGDIIKY